MKIVISIIRVLQFVKYTIPTVVRVRNRCDYYKDIFGTSKKNHWIMRVEGAEIKLRRNSVDRWSALENLVLDKNRVKRIVPMDFDTIIDLGANIGASVLNFHRHFPQAKIVAIEPNPQNIKLLKENIKLNGVERIVEVLEVAVSGSDVEEIKLFLNENDAASSTVQERGGGYEMVKNIPFGALEKLIKGKTVLKVDIEGQEYDLFIPINLKLLKKFSYIIVETHFVSKEVNHRLVKRFLEKNRFNYYRRGRFYFIDNFK